MERVISTGIFERVGPSGRKIFAKNPGVFYRLKDTSFTSSEDIYNRQLHYNADDYFIPNSHHIKLGGHSYYFGTIYTSADNSPEFPDGMSGLAVLIDPLEDDWMLEPKITSLQKTINLITFLIDNNFLTYRNLLYAVGKISVIVDSEIPEYSKFQDFEKLLYTNKNKILSKLDVNLVQSINDCIEKLFELNNHFEVGSLSFKNREYTILPEFEKQHRLLNIFTSYIYPHLLSQRYAVILLPERPLIYKLDFDPDYALSIYTMMKRYVDMSKDNLYLSQQILKRLDIADLPENYIDTPVIIPDTEVTSPGNEVVSSETTIKEDQTVTVQPVLDAKQDSSGGTLVKLLSFGYLISKFIR